MADPKLTDTEAAATALMRDALRHAGGDILVAVSALVVAAGNAAGAALAASNPEHSQAFIEMNAELFETKFRQMQALLNPNTPPN